MNAPLHRNFGVVASRVYSPTTPSSTLLIRAIYWAKHLAVALLAIAASIALGCGFGALAIWMNS